MGEEVTSGRSDWVGPTCGRLVMFSKHPGHRNAEVCLSGTTMPQIQEVMRVGKEK